MTIEHIPDDAPICASGKRPFRDQVTAERQLGHVRHMRTVDNAGHRRRGGLETKAYACPVCGWWHFASTDGVTRRQALHGKRKGWDRRA